MSIEDSYDADEHRTFDTRWPNLARAYNSLLGGKDCYPTDIAFANEVIADYPLVTDIVRANRYFIARAVRYLAGVRLIDQFLDLGTGLPSIGSSADKVHEFARETRPDARALYVDNDPNVVMFGKAWLQVDRQTWMAEGDIRHPKAIIENAIAEGQIDFGRPVAVLLCSVLHYFDGDMPWQIIESFRKVMAPGSCLVISHAESSPQMDWIARLYRDVIGVGTTRTREEIAAMFDGFELVAPGVVSLPEWRPDLMPLEPLGEFPFVGGIGRLR